MEEENLENLSRREKRKLLREEQKQEQESNKAMKQFIKPVAVLLITVLLFVGGWWLFTRPGIPQEEIISQKGLHWHPELTIYIRGQKQEISANIGIGVAHEPIHTHDNFGTLHMEMRGLVTKKDTRLGRFFKIWGKQFNQNCIFEFCNGESGTVKMTVNGQENKELENYKMRDKDKIEIKYE